VQDTGHGADSDFESKVVSAVGEAFNNIAIHAYRDVPPGNVELEIRLTEHSISIQLGDTGRAFDPTSVTPPDLGSLPENHMGLFIIKSFMDDVTYRPGAAPGEKNLLRLEKRFLAPKGG
jgi:serine/threonine-protein kinase RsbW